MYNRAIMSFQRISYGPATITTMIGNEPGYCEGGRMLVSIAGPGLPNIRVTDSGIEPLSPDDMPGNGMGVIVFGHSKADRPRLGLDAAATGAIGGRRRTARKIHVARENGKKGGRPKQHKAIL